MRKIHPTACSFWFSSDGPVSQNIREIVPSLSYNLLKALLIVLLSGIILAGFVSAETGNRKHYVVTQYWGFFGDGESASSVHWDMVNYGEPTVGRYYSGDPAVAEDHLNQMLSSGINVVSFGWMNQKGDDTVWNGLDPDQSFQEGIMKAPSFDKIKFCISYDMATRAWLVHLAENGNPPKDIVPGITFFDPDIASDGVDRPFYDFSLQSDGKYIYDELLSYDFDYLARTYLQKDNYFKIDGKAVVFIYDSWRFTDGSGNDDLVYGMNRAFVRVRNELYNKYGILLYLVGDFPSYSTTYLNIDYPNGAVLGWPESYKGWGYLQSFDAVNSWNVWDSNFYASYGNISLSSYTNVASDVQNQWRDTTLSQNRTYRAWLSPDLRDKYGYENTSLDFIPLLSFSFMRYPQTGERGFCVRDDAVSDIAGQLSMVKDLRDQSTLSEENADIVYQVAWNQWDEGQIIESSVLNPTDPFPGAYGNVYLDDIKEVLSEKCGNNICEEGESQSTCPEDCGQCQEMIDTLDYFVSKHPGTILTGTHPLSQLAYQNRTFYIKWAGNAYEYYTWDSDYIYLKEDQTGSTGQLPFPYSFSNARWLRRQMCVGETIDSEDNYLTVYNPNTCAIDNDKSRNYPISIKLESHIPDYDIGGTLGTQDVIVIDYYWPGGHEKSYYSNEWGLVRWESYNIATGALEYQSTFDEISTTPPIVPDAGCSFQLCDNNNICDEPIENHTNCPNDCPSAVSSPADLNGDGCIQITELNGFTDHWYMDSSNYSMNDLMEAIRFYKAGTGCPSS